MALDLHVLGPVTATLDGAPVDLRGPKQRAVLACLVSASPRMVPADQLRADVWPEDDPPGVATLHYYVSQLRTALEPGRNAPAEPSRVARSHAVQTGAPAGRAQTAARHADRLGRTESVQD